MSAGADGITIFRECQCVLRSVRSQAADHCKISKDGITKGYNYDPNHIVGGCPKPLPSSKVSLRQLHQSQIPVEQEVLKSPH